MTQGAEPGVVAPSREDPLVAAASELVGGPAGRRLAFRRGFWHAVPVLVLLAVAVLGLGVVQKEHCAGTGWKSPDMFWHACYSDIGVLYASTGLSTAKPGLIEAVTGNSDKALQQPPLTGVAMWGVAQLVDRATPGPSLRAAQQEYFHLSAVLLGGCLVLAVLAVALAAGRRQWDAAHVALSPVIVTAGLVSYDLLAVALSALALLAWARRRPGLAGALLGLAIATRPLTAIICVGILAVAVRAWALRAAFWFGVWLLITWGGLRLLLYPGLDGGLRVAWGHWKESGPGYGSIWLVPQLLAQNRPRTALVWYTGGALSPTVVTTAALLGTICVVGTCATLTFAAVNPPRIALIALLAMSGCLLVAKSVPVQASLLLLPLVALAGLRWRDHLIWAGTEAAYFIGVWLYIAASSNPRGLPGGFYLILLLLRLGGIAWLGVQALRGVVSPARQPDRRAALRPDFRLVGGAS